MQLHCVRGIRGIAGTWVGYTIPRMEYNTPMPTTKSTPHGTTTTLRRWRRRRDRRPRLESTSWLVYFFGDAAMPTTMSSKIGDERSLSAPAPPTVRFDPVFPHPHLGSP